MRFYGQDFMPTFRSDETFLSSPQPPPPDRELCPHFPCLRALSACCSLHLRKYGRPLQSSSSPASRSLVWDIWRNATVRYYSTLIPNQRPRNFPGYFMRSLGICESRSKATYSGSNSSCHTSPSPVHAMRAAVNSV